MNHDGSEARSASGLPSAIMWVKDAPMFIDEANLDRFYDAIVRPAFSTEETRTLNVSEARRKELVAKLGAEAGLKLPSWLAGLLSGGVSAAANAEGTSESSNSSDGQIVLRSIDTPQRQLEQLLAFFLVERTDRLLTGQPSDTLTWQADGKSAEVPRALVLLDVPKSTKLIPTAAEFENGSVSLFFNKLERSNGERPPIHIGEEKALWEWLGRDYIAEQAMKSIEDAAREQKSRIEWIDYRLLINDDGDTMHLHLEADRRYFTGTFAYRLVRRCYRHGMRIVGTLKDGPDLNVLAIYEK
jgi:hypothetical protein